MSQIESASAPSNRFVDEEGSVIVLGIQNRARVVAIKFWDRPGLYQWNRKERYEILEIDLTKDDSMLNIQCYGKKIKNVYSSRYGYIDITVEVFYHTPSPYNRDYQLGGIKIKSEGLFSRGECY